MRGHGAAPRGERPHLLGGTDAEPGLDFVGGNIIVGVSPAAQNFISPSNLRQGNTAPVGKTLHEGCPR